MRQGDEIVFLAFKSDAGCKDKREGRRSDVKG